MPPFLDGEGAVFVLVNRGKKSVALDLKDARGKDAFLDLVSCADVVVESFRPGVMARLGLDYQIFRARNERLIYVAITGYGQDGPYKEIAGHDVNYMALGGAIDITGPEDGPPAIPGRAGADLSGGALQAVIGVLLALAGAIQERAGANGGCLDAGWRGLAVAGRVSVTTRAPEWYRSGARAC
jgi:alpha-methylacyl-CoA racemase